MHKGRAMRGIEEIDLKSPIYTPNRLFDKAAELLQVKNDATLALVLECDQALLCRIRRRKSPLSAWLMIQIMDRTGWHIKYVRELAGIPYDGVSKLVAIAHEIGMRFPQMWTVEPEESALSLSNERSINTITQFNTQA